MTLSRTLAIFGVLASFACKGDGKRASAVPSSLVLWAWHGKHDLRFLDSRAAHDRPIEVAFLARRLVVHREGVEAQVRAEPLDIDPRIPLTAVIRIELARETDPARFEKHMPTLLDHLSRVAEESGVETVQIDFDAPRSFRSRYGDLLSRARQRLATGQRLEVTALASWCLDDRWLDGALVDAVVPMVFEMGPEGPAIRSRLHERASFDEPACRGQIGVSTTDVIPPIPKGDRVFVFAPGSWTEDRLAHVESLLAARGR